jgi:hypothetical protein
LSASADLPSPIQIAKPGIAEPVDEAIVWLEKAGCQVSAIQWVGRTKTPQGRAVGSLWLSQEGIPMKCDARLATDNGKVSTIR